MRETVTTVATSGKAVAIIKSINVFETEEITVP